MRWRVVGVVVVVVLTALYLGAGGGSESKRPNGRKTKQATGIDRVVYPALGKDYEEGCVVEGGS